MKCIQTENSDVHSMYYGSLHFILFWGIAGNSPIFPEHIHFLNPRPVPTVSEKTVLVPVPEYWGFSGRGTICPQNGFPSPPRNSPKHFHKALPIPAPSPKLGEGDGFPQVSRPQLASLLLTYKIVPHTSFFSFSLVPPLRFYGTENKCLPLHLFHYFNFSLDF